MHAPDEAGILTLWERGLGRHPIDRALMLCAWVRTDLPLTQVPSLPLGAVNTALLRLRAACFGPAISAYADCGHCGVRMEINLDTRQLLANAKENDSPAEFELGQHRFRVPCSRDLAAVAQEQDVQLAAVKLLQHCCLSSPNPADVNLSDLLGEAEAIMAELDPEATIDLALNCGDCGSTSLTGFNIGSLLWDEIDAKARALLNEVHNLALAYGWSEHEILALSPQRRTAYLDRVTI